MEKPKYITSIPQGVLLQIKVQPNSPRNGIVGPEGEYLKIKLQSPPVGGAANKNLIQFLRKTFRIPQKNIQIRRGEKSRIKMVEILGITYKDCLTVVSSPH